LRRRLFILVILAAGLTGATSWVAAQQQKASAQAETTAATSTNSASSSGGTAKSPSAIPSATAAAPHRSDASDRVEGEKRFRANCARCHQEPHKFPPRAMATIIRHMRVRATLTDEDERLILKYMTQ
jgi:mono/diheme cytochrome c family protein